MEPILAAFLALLPSLPGDLTAFINFWNLVKPGAPAPTRTAIDGLLAAMDAKLDKDIDDAANAAQPAPQPQPAKAPAGPLTPQPA